MRSTRPCAANGVATIGFAPALAGTTITLENDDMTGANVYGQTAFVIDGAVITIDGAAAPGLVISGNNALRPFAVTTTGSLTLEDLTVEDGLAQGFAGGRQRMWRWRRRRRGDGGRGL